MHEDLAFNAPLIICCVFTYWSIFYCYFNKWFYL